MTPEKLDEITQVWIEARKKKHTSELIATQARLKAEFDRKDCQRAREEMEQAERELQDRL